MTRSSSSQQSTIRRASKGVDEKAKRGTLLPFFFSFFFLLRFLPAGLGRLAVDEIGETLVDPVVGDADIHEHVVDVRRAGELEVGAG